MTKRTYTSELRARSARETHAAVLRAAQELFTEQGYARTTIPAVAARAGVAVNTVYTSVGGKAALIAELTRAATSDDVIEATLAEILALSDGRRILERLAESTGVVMRRQETLIRVLLENATADPAVAGAAELSVRRYRERLSRIAAHLVTIGAVDGDAQRTEQVLWFYFGTSAWTTVSEFGWPEPEAAAWLATQAAGALLT
ncbi:TetR/AcrR family transcriptional regulator [Actinoplanes palleronii]|uniref:TetR/AcrR family transcriptional regulator n=1 Tax=Actinoplanes palleronii TaxID=113570 RepID=UPI00194484FD|nr:TetR family transcriptional regulator [Actinoplanes palleronii]